MTETNYNDFKAGQRDHKAGVYDKWYRWNRRDDGAAYDDGFKSITNDKEINIIECMHTMDKELTLTDKILKYM